MLPPMVSGGGGGPCRGLCPCGRSRFVPPADPDFERTLRQLAVGTGTVAEPAAWSRVTVKSGIANSQAVAAETRTPGVPCRLGDCVPSPSTVAPSAPRGWGEVFGWSFRSRATPSPPGSRRESSLPDGAGQPSGRCQAYPTASETDAMRSRRLDGVLRVLPDPLERGGTRRASQTPAVSNKPAGTTGRVPWVSAVRAPSLNLAYHVAPTSHGQITAFNIAEPFKHLSCDTWSRCICVIVEELHIYLECLICEAVPLRHLSCSSNRHGGE